MFGLLKITSYYRVNIDDVITTETGVSINFSAPILGYITAIVVKDDVIVGCKSSESPMTIGNIKLNLPESYRGESNLSLMLFTLGVNDNNRFIGKTTNSVWFEKIPPNDISHIGSDNSKLKGAQIINIPTVGLTVNVSFNFTGKSTAYHGVVIT